MPVKAAGPRTEIMTSLPMPIGDMPAAIAADSPPDEPPGVRSRFQGLLVRPVTRLSVSVQAENSGTFVFIRGMPLVGKRDRKNIAVQPLLRGLDPGLEPVTLPAL